MSAAVAVMKMSLVLLACLFVLIGLKTLVEDGRSTTPQPVRVDPRQIEREAFKTRCESLGGIVVKRGTDNWFSGTHYTDDCAFPPKVTP